MEVRHRRRRAEGRRPRSRAAQSDGLVKIVDHAVVSWPEGAEKPEVHHSHDDKVRGTGWGAFWGLLFGGLFFVPLLGAAVGAAAGAACQGGRRGRHPAEPAGRASARRSPPGTSLLCAVTENADMDRLGERMHGLHSTLVATNLTDAERSLLLETFG